jgi:hypothetical protein
VDSLAGYASDGSGLWLTVSSIVPGRDSALFHDRSPGIGEVRSDLVQGCGPLHWISDGAICDKLKARLEENPRAFLTELETHYQAQHVAENAYWR